MEFARAFSPAAGERKRLSCYALPMRGSVFWIAFALGLWLGAEGLLGLLILTVIFGFIPFAVYSAIIDDADRQRNY